MPHLEKGGGGSIIITSGVNGARTFSNPGASTYSSSKAGRVAFMKMAVGFSADGLFAVFAHETLSFIGIPADNERSMDAKRSTLSCHAVRQASPSRAGFTLVEIMLALFVFGMITLLFGAVFPVASRAGHTASNYAEAAMIGQRKIDQCRQAGYANTYGSSAGSKMTALGIIDNPQPAGYPIVSGATTTYTFTLVDKLAANGAVKGYYSDGTTGTLSIGPVPGGAGWAAPSVGQAVLVTAAIQWTGGPQGSGLYTSSTLIRSY